MLLIISVHVLRLTKKDTLCFKVISVPSASAAAATAALEVKDFMCWVKDIPVATHCFH